MWRALSELGLGDAGDILLQSCDAEMDDVVMMRASLKQGCSFRKGCFTAGVSVAANHATLTTPRENQWMPYLHRLDS